MSGPAPKSEPVVFAGEGAGCPAPFVRCLDAANAGALIRNVGALQTYALEAETACYTAPVTDGGTP